MEVVLKNLESTTELLAVVSTGVVEQWDEQTLDRAFKWARYCEHLHSKFHTKPTVRTIMEQRLQVTNERLQSTFQGYAEVTFEDLSRCQHLLLTRLLKNPVVSSGILKILFNGSRPFNTDGHDSQAATGHCTLLVECRSACKVLKDITRLTSVAGPEADVQGMMLMESLEAFLCPDSKVDMAKKFLDSVLQICERSDNTCIYLGIASALKSRVNNTTTKDFLFNWLQQNNRLLQTMFSTLSVGQLTDLAKHNVKFRVAYCNALKKWASDMEFDIDEGEWVQTDNKQTNMSFKKLKEHFLSLFEACPSLREDIEEELSALKISDGDFDVKSLSVWGDLLLQLKK